MKKLLKSFGSIPPRMAKHPQHRDSARETYIKQMKYIFAQQGEPAGEFEMFEQWEKYSTDKDGGTIVEVVPPDKADMYAFHGYQEVEVKETS